MKIFDCWLWDSYKLYAILSPTTTLQSFCALCAVPRGRGGLVRGGSVVRSAVPCVHHCYPGYYGGRGAVESDPRSCVYNR